MKVGFIGLGIMGTPMAEHLIKAGHEVLLYSIPNIPASLVEAGGKAWFTTLADLDGNWVPSKLVDTRYGTRWVLLDANGRFIQGSWMGAFPRRRSTMTRKGFREVQGLWPAVAKMQGSGTGLSGTAWVATVKAADDLTPPDELDLDFVPYGQDADK